jgi:hypothetical protein
VGALIVLAMMLYLGEHRPTHAGMAPEQTIPCCLSHGCARHHHLSGNPCGQSWDWEK